MFATLNTSGHEQVVHFHESAVGLRCIVAIHSTVLGPAIGGLRMWPYASDEAALQDALRQSQAMTYRAAMAGLSFGGGKAVLIGDPTTDKSEALLRALGRCVERLGGRYIVSADLGTTVEDMDLIHTETDHVVGVHPVNGGSGDPAIFTALGTLHGIRAALAFRYGNEELARHTYAVQGSGSVGQQLVRSLRASGAKVFVSDINEQRVDELVDATGAERVPMDQIYDVDATVFSPCAMGSVINEDTIPRLRCAIVAGGAHHQLESERCGTLLSARGILYAPDYVINAGGLINATTELSGYSADRARHLVSCIHGTLGRVFEAARRQEIPTWQAANALAEQRIAAIRALTPTHVSPAPTSLSRRPRDPQRLR
jgi:leucine dehydrogenase